MAQIQLPTEKSSMQQTPLQTNNEREHLSSIVGEGEARRAPRVEHKLRNIFISEDAGSVGDYLVWKVFVPAIQNMLVDAGHGIVDTIFGRGGAAGHRNYGGYGYSGERRSYDRGSYRGGYSNGVGYGSYYAYDDRRRRVSDSRDSEVIFRSRAKAEEALDILSDIARREGSATVDHLSDLIGVPFQDRDDRDREWGWDIQMIDRGRIRGTRDGYALQLPTPIPV